MKKIESKIIIIYILLLTYLIFGKIIFVNNIDQSIVDPIMWAILFGITYLLTRKEKGRYKNKVDKIKTILIIVLIYLMLYFSSGLLVGYAKSPYSHSIDGIINNIWQFITVIIFEEYIRSILVGYTRGKKSLYILIVIIFTLFDMNFYHISSNFITFEEGFKYVSSNIFPLLVQNCIFTHLAINAGMTSVLTYRIPITITKISLPILPNYDWFMKGITESILPVIVFLVINKGERVEVRRPRKQKQRIDIFSTLLIVILLFFVTGIFKYKPISIMSNSMAPAFYRGDVVIIEKLEENQEIKIGDVIEYKLEQTMIIHRVIEIKEIDGEKKYKTKGDANNTSDTELVSMSQIEGIAKLKLSYIGYPAVLLHDIFSPNKNIGVEAPR